MCVGDPAIENLVTSVLTVTDPLWLFDFERSQPGPSAPDSPAVVMASRSFLTSRDMELS